MGNAMIKASECFSYLKGALDIIELFPKTAMDKINYSVCVPKDSIYIETLRNLVINTLKEAPELLNNTARMAVVVTLATNYSCAK